MRSILQLQDAPASGTVLPPAFLARMARSQELGALRYAAGKYRAWFTGMAPIENPRIIVAVMVDEPTAGSFYGGTVAAPVFSEVVQQTLRLMGVQPDMEVKPLIVANPVEEPSL
jgi:hypothetical protein